MRFTNPHARPRGRSSSAAPVVLGLVAAVVAGACAEGPEVDPQAHEPEVRVRALLEGSDERVLPLAGGDTVHFGDAVRAFYEARDYEPAWTSRDGFLDRGKALIAALHGADEEGLSRTDYHRESIHELIEQAESQAAADLPVGDLLGNLDLLLSEAFLRYTADIRQGTVDPSQAGVNWTIPREDPPGVEFLNALVEHEDFERALEELRPGVPFYGRLKTALARYRAIEAEGGWPSVASGETLEEGMTGERVTQVRRRLLAEGDSVEGALVRKGSRADLFDAALARAVEHFQERHGIEKDGRVGATTLTEMNIPVEDRVMALRLNLDRWRWLPQDLGERYVLVNVAGFEMAIMRGDEPEIQMNVVVGQEGWETPIFQDTMEYIVVNPYWNVPRSIAEDEVIPAARRDPSYLSRNNFEVTTASGKAVNPASVDLSSNAYTIRQKPGRGNALGTVKFLFPNDNNIYLHDTPANHLFSRSGRAFSHGCIRVEDPERLAKYLLKTSTYRSEDDFEAIRATREETWVEMQEKLPVYILYFTAWAEPDGAVHFYRDVYKRDRRMEELARTQLEQAPKRPAAAGGAVSG